MSISIEIGKSLLFLHYSKIVHRDIKSHNILLDENNITKLCDFGLAKNFVLILIIV
ncbi:MAG: protein kinase domain-containing protein [bacterium]